MHQDNRSGSGAPVVSTATASDQGSASGPLGQRICPLVPQHPYVVVRMFPKRHAGARLEQGPQCGPKIVIGHLLALQRPAMHVGHHPIIDTLLEFTRRTG